MATSRIVNHEEDAELVAAALAAARVGICVIDESGRLIHANPHLCSTLGYSPGEIARRTWPELAVPESTLPVAAQGIPRDLASAPREWRLRRKDGSSLRARIEFQRAGEGRAFGAVVATITPIEGLDHAGAAPQSEANYRAAIEGAPIGAVIVHSNRIHLANRMMTEMFGYSADEFLSRGSFLDFLHPDDRSWMADIGRGQIGAPQGRRVLSTFRILRKDGAVRWVEGSAVQVRWAGRPATLAFIIEITERRLAEAALLRSEQRYRHIIENAGEGLLIIGSNRMPLLGNRKFEEIAGYPLEELYRIPLAMLLWDDDRDAVLERFEGRIVGAPLARNYEFRLKHRDGHAVWVQVSATRVEWDQSPAVLAFVSDITARHQSEETLRRSEQQYRDVVNNAAEGIVVVQGDSFAFVNPSFSQLLGLPAEELLGRSIGSVIHPDDVARVRDRRARFMRGESVTPQHSFRVVASDGRTVWIEVSTVTIEWRGHPATLSFVTDVTERTRIEDELRVTKERYDFATAVGKVGTWDWNPANGALAWSAETYRLMGFAPGSVVPTYELYLSLVHPEDRERLNASVMAALNERRPYDLDCRIVLRDGSGLVCHVTGNVEFDADGRPVRMLGTIQDVTERSRLQDDLTRSLQERETILENSIVGIVFLNNEGRCAWANRAAQQMFEGSLEDFVGRSIERFYLSREAYLATGAEVEAAVLAGRAFEAERQMRSTHGRVFWVLLSGKAVSPRDLSRGTVWSIIDISARKELEEALRRASAEREAILQNTLVGMTYLHGRRIQWVNRRLAEQVGCEPEALIGKSIRTLAPDDESYDRLEAAADRLLREQGHFRVEHPIRRSDGSLVWVDVYGTFVDRTQPERGSIWTILDIAERRQAQEDMRIALEKQRELSELKSRFVSMSSHEFRTPLAAIMSSAELMRDYGERLPPGERAELLGIVTSAVRRMSRLLDDVLTIGKADAGRLELTLAKVDLSSLSERIIAEARTVARDAGAPDVAVRLAVSGARREAELDENLLRHILGNLLSNALKYSRTGGTVDFDVECEPDRTLFIVADHGIGIPPEDLPHMFETFHRASNVRNIPGTGLGLAIVKRAVDRHGGTIEIQSELGRGTRFVVCIPGG